MKRMRTVALAVTTIALFTLLPQTARTDAWNKKTFVTFSDAVETPGGVLPPGRYVFKLADSLSDRHIVQILNDRENHVEATVLAFSKYRAQPADKSIFTFYETRAGEPHALQSWFYPGDTIGQEFAYPKRRAVLLAAATGQRVPSSVNTIEAPPPAPTTEAQAPMESPSATEASNNSAPAEPVELAQNRPPEQPTVIEQEQPREQSPAPEPAAPATMPQTASEWPLVALLGAFSLGAAILVRTLVRFSA